MGYKKYFIYTLLFLLSLAVLSGCIFPTSTSSTKGRYNASDCKKVPFRPDRAADKVVVKQSAHKLYVYQKGKIIKTMPVSLGKNTMRNGPKVKQGDYCTPVGRYTIVDKRCHYLKYRAMTISYPNTQDLQRAKKLGVKPGSYITFHGQPYWNKDGHGDSYTLRHDWTNGCIALTNSDLDWLWSSVKVGTVIEINR